MTTTTDRTDRFQAPTPADSLQASGASVGGETHPVQSEQEPHSHSIMNASTSAGWVSLTALLTHTVFTLGYRAEGAMEQVEQLVRDHNATVLDIRTMPRSRYYPQWNRKALEARFGVQHYDHLELLGNVNYRTPELPIALQDAHNGLLWLCVYLQRRNVVLLCGCPQPLWHEHRRHKASLRLCHRYVVCQLLQQHFPPLAIKHLVRQRDDEWSVQRHEEVQARCKCL